MLKGKIISLRLMRESDLETVYNYHLDIESRGEFFPVGVVAEPVYRQRFASTGILGKRRRNTSYCRYYR